MNKVIVDANKLVYRRIHKVVVDRGLCIGAGPCVVVAPDAFDLDKEDKAFVKGSWKKLDNDTLLIAAQSCPVQAIFLYNKKGKQIFPNQI